MTTTVIPIGTMSEEEARSLTDEVKADAHTLWTKLLRLFEGNAHKALGYRTWAAYYEAEFGGSARESHRLLAAGRVLESLEPEGFRGEGSPGSPLLNEATARELQPLLRNGADAVREAYEEAVEQAGGEKPTASQMREVVRRRRQIEVVPEPDPVPPPKPEPPAWVADLDLLRERLTGDLHWLAASAHAPTNEIVEAAKIARTTLSEIAQILERLAGT